MRYRSQGCAFHPAEGSTATGNESLGVQSRDVFHRRATEFRAASSGQRGFNTEESSSRWLAMSGTLDGVRHHTVAFHRRAIQSCSLGRAGDVTTEGGAAGADAHVLGIDVDRRVARLINCWWRNHLPTGKCHPDRFAEVWEVGLLPGRWRQHHAWV